MKYMVKNNKRFIKTLAFLNKYTPPPQHILDLGVSNQLSDFLRSNNYSVTNSQGEDLDLNYDIVQHSDFTLITAFEIIEHLVSPFPLLRAIKAEKLIATVPLNLWFSKAYHHQDNIWDRHYHEFETWQFDWLLQKAGWDIIQSEKWIIPSKKLGIRSILRRFTPRVYAVYCQRSR